MRTGSRRTAGVQARLRIADQFGLNTRRAAGIVPPNISTAPWELDRGTSNEQLKQNQVAKTAFQRQYKPDRRLSRRRPLQPAHPRYRPGDLTVSAICKEAADSIWPDRCCMPYSGCGSSAGTRSKAHGARRPSRLRPQQSPLRGEALLRAASRIEEIARTSRMHSAHAASAEGSRPRETFFRGPQTGDARPAVVADARYSTSPVRTSERPGGPDACIDRG